MVLCTRSQYTTGFIQQIHAEFAWLTALTQRHACISPSLFCFLKITPQKEAYQPSAFKCSMSRGHSVLRYAVPVSPAAQMGVLAEVCLWTCMNDCNKRPPGIKLGRKDLARGKSWTASAWLHLQNSLKHDEVPLSLYRWNKKSTNKLYS